MIFQPLGDRILVRRIESEKVTKGGVLIPDDAQDRPSEGEVVAVGPGGRDERGVVHAPPVKVGDRVMFGQWAGSEIKVAGQDLLILRENDILGIVA